MALSVNSNISALTSQRQLLKSSNSLNTASERLSSGKRINSARDDAAGLTIANRMTSQIRGLNQAIRNSLDGVSMIQVAEGALSESGNILQRIRELSIQSSNGIYNDADRAVLDVEAQQLVTELNRIAETTSFNGKPMLDGQQQNVALQVGANANQIISFSIPAMDTQALGLSSSSGDLSGDQMNISNGGGLAEALDFAAIKINGQNLQGFAIGTQVGEITAAINKDIEGVSASTLVNLTSTKAGTGVLTGSDSITISGVYLDGGNQSYTIGNTDSMDELVAAINSTSGGNISASITDSGTLNLSSTKFSTLSLQDTSGTATGIDAIADPKIAEVLAGINSNWLAQAENRIETFFGLKGDGVDLTLDLSFTDGVGGVGARVVASVPVLPGSGVGTNLSLEIDMADFTASGDPSGGNGPFYMDRLLAHEMVHAVMFRQTAYTQTLPGWFSEGIAELIQGADERVESTAGILVNQAAINANFKTTAGSPSDSAGYSVAYLAAKSLHQDILNAGGTGIDEVMARLDIDGPGETLDQALAFVATARGIGDWSDLATYEDHFGNATTGTGFTFISSLNLDAGAELDTGAIGGSDYGGTALNAEDVINNSVIGGAQDFNLIIPSQYSGGQLSADAQLILTSDNNEPVTITQGSTGSDAALALLGFNSVSAAGVITGGTLDASAQNTALNQGDLIINQIAIESVAANEGLFAKVNAINKATDDTGVTAAIVAQQAFKLTDTSSSIEMRSAAGGINISAGSAGILGINGIGMTINQGDTALDIAATINTLSTYHGATAYSDDQGRLHIESNSTLNLGANNGNLIPELGLNDHDASGLGSITLNSQKINLSDINSTETLLNDINAMAGQTGVTATIDDSSRLQLRGSFAINIGLGDTNGLQTLRTLGIDFGIGGGEMLTDSNGDKRLGDEVFTIKPRIELNSFNDADISVKVTANGAIASGLSNLNALTDALSGSGLNNIKINTQAGAQAAIESVDNALETINNTRAQLGAVNNRLDFTISNLTNVSEKTASARSRIVDTDFALESANLTRAQIMQQAAQAMLAQANQKPQMALSLLR